VRFFLYNLSNCRTADSSENGRIECFALLCQLLPQWSSLEIVRFKYYIEVAFVVSSRMQNTNDLNRMILTKSTDEQFM
jgi:hypothetical protein